MCRFVKIFEPILVVDFVNCIEELNNKVVDLLEDGLYSFAIDGGLSKLLVSHYFPLFQLVYEYYKPSTANKGRQVVSENNISTNRSET